MTPSRADSNGVTKVERISKCVRDLGFPVVAALALGWIGVSYWLQPLTARQEAQWMQDQDAKKAEVEQRRLLIDTMASTYKQLGEAVDAMRDSEQQQIATMKIALNSIQTNGELIKEQSKTTMAVNTLMADAQKLMAPVPAMRAEQLDLAKRTVELLEKMNASGPN